MPGPRLENNEVHESTSWAAVKPPTVKKESQPLSFVPKQRGSPGLSGRRSSFFFFFSFFLSSLRGLVRFFSGFVEKKDERWKSCTGFLPTWSYGTWWRMSVFFSLCGFLRSQDCRVKRRPKAEEQVLWMARISSLMQGAEVFCFMLNVAMIGRHARRLLMEGWSRSCGQTLKWCCHSDCISWPSAPEGILGFFPQQTSNAEPKHWRWSF